MPARRDAGSGSILGHARRMSRCVAVGWCVRRAAAGIFSVFLMAGLLMASVSNAAAGDAAALPWQTWQSTLLKEHPLAGKLWSAKDRAFVEAEALAAAAVEADFVLLGEIHDNPDHHRLQAWVIARGAARKSAVVFEMIRADQDAALAAYVARPDAGAAGLGGALDWGQGWPDWKTYQPIAEAAFAAKLKIMSGDAAREDVRAIGRQGLASLPPERQAALAIGEPLAEPLRLALLDELYQSHCEMMPRERLAPMAGVQRYRDAHLADRLLHAGGGVFLIAGGGHVRSDRGVPWYLSRRAPEKRVLVLVLSEVRAGEDDPQKAAPAAPDGSPAADYVWFTPRTEREDPCKDLAEKMKAKK